jgi:hypothetical protein
LFRLRLLHWKTLTDALFLVLLLVTFVVQLWQGLNVLSHPRSPGSIDTIAILVIVCFLIGIARSWELIGGPSIGLRTEVGALLRDQHASHPADPPGD